MTKQQQDHERPSQDEGDFAQYADQPHTGLVREFLDFLLHNKKWWLTPILLVLILVGLLSILAGTPAGAFIYTLF